MEQLKCGCQRQGTYIYFCVDEKCTLNRKICADCRIQHKGHSKIMIENRNSLSFYEANAYIQHRQNIKRSLQLTLQNLLNMKNKIIHQIQNYVDSTFKKWIFRPIELLIGTTETGQEQAKRASITNRNTSSQELNEIAIEIQTLINPCFKDYRFIVEFCRIITADFEKMKQLILTQFHQRCGPKVDNFKSISPYSKKMIQNAVFTLKKTQEQEERNRLQYIKRRELEEETRSNFLYPFGAVIGSNSSELTTFQQWKLCDKPLLQIQYLNFSKKSLKYIPQFPKYISKSKWAVWQKPQPFNAFPIMKSLNLAQNKIKVIQHIQSLKSLQQLYLNNNYIEKIPDMQMFTHLKYLNLYSNQIKKIEGIGTLFMLQYLNLGWNSIKKIENLQNLTKIQILSLASNKIEKLQKLNNLKNLKKLWLYENPLLQNEKQKVKIDILIQKGIKIVIQGLWKWTKIQQQQ